MLKCRKCSVTYYVEQHMKVLLNIMLVQNYKYRNVVHTGISIEFFMAVFSLCVEVNAFCFNFCNLIT